MRFSFLDRPRLFGLTRRRLQTLYIVAAAGLAALVPLILFAGLWIRGELNKTQRDVELFLNARAAALSGQVDAELERQLVAMRALSTLPTLDDNLIGFEEAARRIAPIMSYWSSLSLIDAETGKVLFSTRSDLGERFDRTGLRRAVETKRPAIETRPPADGAEGAVLIFVPVVQNDTVRQILLTVLEANDVQNVVMGQSRESRLIASVVDAKGRILARSLSPERMIGHEISARARETIGDRSFGLFDIESPEGEPLKSAFVRSGLTGWISVVSINRGQSDGLMARSVWATIVAGALSLALTGILAVFIIHTIMERRVSEERLSASRALSKLDARLLATSQEALGEQRKAAYEREVLLREIYHRVKNNLQIVQSLLRLGSRDLKPDQREPFENAVRRIGAMSRVHTLLYNSPDLASIDFRDYLEELLGELADGFGAEDRGIVSELKAEPMRISLDTAVPLAFIAVEILTNAFKHAFPNGRPGRISVEVRREGEAASLTIGDDGVGIVGGSLTKKRLGLTIVRKLVQQIGGTIDEPPPGSSAFTIRFPLTEAAGGGDHLPSPPEAGLPMFDEPDRRGLPAHAAS